MPRVVCPPRVRWRLNEARNAKIQNSRRPRGIHKDVTRFQIAVNYQVAVYVLDRPAAVEYQSDNLRRRKLLFDAILVDGRAVNVVHHQIRPPGFRHALVDDSRNVGVVESRQDLAFALKPFVLAGEESRSDYLNCKAPRALQPDVLGKVYKTSPALPEMPQDAIPVHDVAGHQGFGGP
jgi:hypothetical protein